jgi:hypothetical protein
MNHPNYSIGPIVAAGAVTVDFAIPPNLPPDQVVQAIERDRLHMAKRPGLRQKHLPVRLDPGSGNFLSGGRYLFDSFENARNYRAWVENEFVLDGTKFFQRPYFLEPSCQVWRVIGGHDFGDIHRTHRIIRSERWRLGSGDRGTLERAWPGICAEAQKRGLSSVWLLHDEADGLAGLVTIADPLATDSSKQTEESSLRPFEASPSLGLKSGMDEGMKVFDRTSWVLTIWFPITGSAEDVLPVWPNSPPLPAPEYAKGDPQA